MAKHPAFVALICGTLIAHPEHTDYYAACALCNPTGGKTIRLGDRKMREDLDAANARKTWLHEPGVMAMMGSLAWQSELDDVLRVIERCEKWFAE